MVLQDAMEELTVAYCELFSTYSFVDPQYPDLIRYWRNFHKIFFYTNYTDPEVSKQLIECTRKFIKQVLFLPT